MSANPLMDRNLQGNGRVTREQIFDAVERYNRLNWVRMSGIPYTVGTHVDSEGIEHVFIDRK